MSKISQTTLWRGAKLQLFKGDCLGKGGDQCYVREVINAFWHTINVAAKSMAVIMTVIPQLSVTFQFKKAKRWQLVLSKVS